MGDKLDVIQKLVKLALDERGNENERANAALKALMIAKSEGMFIHFTPKKAPTKVHPVSTPRSVYDRGPFGRADVVDTIRAVEDILRRAADPRRGTSRRFWEEPIRGESFTHVSIDEIMGDPIPPWPRSDVKARPSDRSKQTFVFNVPLTPNETTPEAVHLQHEDWEAWVPWEHCVVDKEVAWTLILGVSGVWALSEDVPGKLGAFGFAPGVK